ncbi:GPM6B protein, partial [Polypterus senegalus]
LAGCFECCIKCLGGVPYASLVATILCFSGVALFCGCGHVALEGTLSIIGNHFSQTPSDHALLAEVVQLMQYIIYGIASFFFLYGIILLAEGFYTTSAVKELHSEFKTTACGRCISGMFVFLTYVLGVAWLGVFGFSAVPVFLFYNMWSTCEALNPPLTNTTASPDVICVDMRHKPFHNSPLSSRQIAPSTSQALPCKMSRLLVHCGSHKPQRPEQSLKVPYDHFSFQTAAPVCKESCDDVLTTIIRQLTILRLSLTALCYHLAALPVV